MNGDGSGIGSEGRSGDRSGNGTKNGDWSGDDNGSENREGRGGRRSALVSGISERKQSRKSGTAVPHTAPSIYVDRRWRLKVAIIFGRNTRRPSEGAVPRGE